MPCRLAFTLRKPVTAHTPGLAGVTFRYRASNFLRRHSYCARSVKGPQTFGGLLMTCANEPDLPPFLAVARGPCLPQGARATFLARLNYVFVKKL